MVKGEERETEWDGWIWCRDTSGTEGWVPKTYLEATSKPGLFRFLQDYDARELTADQGMEVLVMYEVSSWAWVRTSLGEEGWIPLENLQRLNSKPDAIPDFGE